MYSEQTYDNYLNDCEERSTVLDASERYGEELLEMWREQQVSEALNSDLLFVENRRKALATL